MRENAAMAIDSIVAIKAKRIRMLLTGDGAAAASVAKTICALNRYASSSEMLSERRPMRLNSDTTSLRRRS